MHKSRKETREDLERVIFWAEYHKNLPHAFTEEIQIAELLLAGAQCDLAKLDAEGR